MDEGDEALRAIAEAVEANRPCPPMRLVTAGWFVAGLPAPRMEYLRRAYQSVNQSLADAARNNGSPSFVSVRRKDGPRQPGTNEALAPVAAGIDLADQERPTALHLVNVTLVSGGSAITTPAIRVPLASISAWTICEAEPVKSSSWGLSVGFFTEV